MSRFENLSTSRLAVANSDSATKTSMVTVALTPVSVAAATAAYQNLTVPGVIPGDNVLPVTDPITNSTALVSARVASANTVSLQFINPTAGALTPTAGTYTFLVIPQA